MLLQVLTLLSLASAAFASHVISIENKCTYGTPTMFGPTDQALFKNGPVNIAGGHTVEGNLNGFIIYLQNNNKCGTSGDNCLIVEGSLNNGFSSVDISKIPPHSFDSPVGFSYTDGSGGRRCDSPDCQCGGDAFCKTDDNAAQVGSPNVAAGITVTFC